MFFGVKISAGLSDWQVLQRHDGKAEVSLCGRWRLEDGAVRAGVRSVTPVIRVMSELDQRVVLPWTPCASRSEDGQNGEWDVTLALPQGGPYRVETSLDAVSAASGDHWMFHGDIRVHIGVGDVFVMAGQSNAAGYAKGVAFDPPDPRVCLLRNRGKWDMAAHPMNDATDAPDCANAPMGITGTSPFLAFGREYADAAGVPVGLIQAAQGGSPISRWDESRNGDLLRGMLGKMGDACAVLWYQGCADASEELAPLYADSFAALVRDVRAHAGWEVPFFTMQLNKYTSQPDALAWAQIKELQRQAALTMPAVWLLPTSTLPMSDEVHNSAAGNVTLGGMLAKQVYSVLHGAGDYAAPALEKAWIDEGRLHLSFSAQGDLMRAGAPTDLTDFWLEDENGAIAVTGLTVRGHEAVLEAEKPLGGKVFVSYGVDPNGPVRAIVDTQTWLPLIDFYRVEVSA